MLPCDCYAKTTHAIYSTAECTVELRRLDYWFGYRSASYHFAANSLSLTDFRKDKHNLSANFIHAPMS